ncbi:MAG: hypothetical protein WAS36_03340 [Candidatus Saccharimonadales bacterium]
MSYSAILAGLNERFATVPTIARVLDYEPTSIQAFPTLYSLLDRVEYLPAGQVRATRYRVLHRLCLRWQDNERAEEQLVPYVDSLAAAIRADPRLGGRITSGLATVVEAQGTFVVIGGALLRCLDLYTETLVKE